MTLPLIYSRCPDDFADLFADKQACFGNKSPEAATRRSATVRVDDMGRAVCNVFNGQDENLLHLRESPADLKSLFRLAHDGDADALERLRAIAAECIEEVEACPTKNCITLVPRRAA